VDGHSLAYRSYYAFAKGRDGGLKTSSGIPTSVCFGFLKALLETIASQQPQYMAIAFDLGLPTFRHEADDTYKADRAETPEDFITDLKNLHELLDALNLRIVTAAGYEADDVLGTMATEASSAGYRAKILTGDRDLFQLVDPEKQISVLYLSGQWRRSNPAESSEFSSQQVKDKLGITPAQVVDYKALCGDASDNIPGVRGIGEKTAVKLLNDYETLDRIYASLDKIPGALKKKLEEGKDAAYHSQHLARLVLTTPLAVSLADCQLQGFNESLLIPILEKLEFKSYLPKIRQLQQAFGGKIDLTPQPPSLQGKGETILPSPLWGGVVFTSDDEDNDQLWFFSLEDTKAAQKQLDSIISPQIVDSKEKLDILITQLQSCVNPDYPVAWDTETNALEPRDAELVGIGCCWGTELTDIAYIPLTHQVGNNLDKATVLAALRPILESDSYPKTLQNAKFDRLVFRCHGINLAGVVFDTMLASYVLNPDNSHNLNNLFGRLQKYLQSFNISIVKQLFSYSIKTLESLPEVSYWQSIDLELFFLAYKILNNIKNLFLLLALQIKSYSEIVPKDKNIGDLPIPVVADYCGTQVYATFQLVGKLRSELEAVPRLYRLLLEVEQPLEPVLAEMEYQGIRIDAAYLQKFSQQLEKDLTAIEKKAYEAIPSDALKRHLEIFLPQLENDLTAIKQKAYDKVNSAILKSYLKEKEVKNSLPDPKNFDLPAIEQKIAVVKQKIDNAANSELLNFNSPVQLSEMLFEILNLNRKKSRKTSTGFYSTDASTLENLQGDHPIIDALLEYRTLHKLFSTYVEAIPKLVRSDTQRVHTQFNQTVTDTGRLSSSNPNLQNIPIGTAFSRQIRQAFLPEPGWLLAAADYSQIELRILAHLTREPALIEAYQNNQDIHTVTAKIVMEKETVTPDERRLAKTINFGVIYGMGAQRFSRSTGINKADAERFIKRFYQSYALVFDYLERVKKEAIARGYVETILGRRRYFNFESGSLRRLLGSNPDDIDLDSLKKMSHNDAQLLRAAANAPIQGSSADIIKVAMVKLHQILQNYRSNLLLQVHDELVLEMPPSEWEELQPQIRSTMENAISLSVPLVVDIHMGQNWMEAK
jgi:DNA polymerase-1